MPDAASSTANWVKELTLTQPWSDDGHEDEYVKRPGRYIPLLKRFGINAICLFPPAAHNHMSSQANQRRTGVYATRRAYTDAQFSSAVRQYQAAGIRVMIYSCLVHVGHDPAWQVLVKEHPEWLMRFADGAPNILHGDSLLCPNNDQARAYVQDYTGRLIRRYQPDMIVLDNNFLIDFTGKRVCYCRECQRKFGDYLRRRGYRAGNRPIPTDRSAPVYDLWIEWRYRAVSAWTRKTMRAFKAIKPDLVVATNTLFHYDHWWTAGEDQCAFVDINVRECYAAPPLISMYAQMGKALGHYRQPLCFSLVTWDENNIHRLKPPELIKARLATIMAHGIIPVLVNYGRWDLDESAPSSQAIKAYLAFYRRHRHYYQDAASCAGVAVCHSRETVCHAAESDRKAYVLSFRAALFNLMGAQVAFDMIQTRFLPEPLLARYKLILLPMPLCIAPSTWKACMRYVKAGGTLVITAATGEQDGQGRRRKTGLVTRLFGKALDASSKAPIEITSGRGRVQFLRQNPGEAYAHSGFSREFGLPLRQLIEQCPGAMTVRADQCSTQVEILPTVQQIQRRRRYVIHVLNHGIPAVLTELRIVVPAKPGFRARRVRMLSPDAPREGAADFTQRGREVAVALPRLRHYAMAIVEE